MAYWGYHLLLDCAELNHDAITDYQTIYNFTKQLVKDIDMVSYGEPQIVNFGTGNKAGYTLVQLIETSNITAHFVEETNDMYLDIFSCKNFNQETVKELVNEYFEPDVMHKRFLYRDAKCDKNCLK